MLAEVDVPGELATALDRPPRPRTLRNRLGYVTALDAEGLRRAPFRHPITGPLTTAQAIRIADVHLRRHTGQLRRLPAG